MKIFFITDKFLPEKTTVGLIVSDLSKKIQDRGHSVSIITTTQKKEEEGESEDVSGLKIFRIYTPEYHERWRAYVSLCNPRVAKKVRQIIATEKPEVIHFHNIHYYVSYYCLKIAKQSGAKVFLTAHDVMLFHYGKLIEFINQDDFSCPDVFNYKISWIQQIRRFKKRYNPFRNFIIRHYIKYADKVLVVSNALKSALEQNHIQNVEVIHNGIDYESWQTAPQNTERFIEKYGLRGKKVVLFGGKITERKGGAQTVLAMEKVVKEVPDASLVFFGSENSYSRSLLELAQSLGIDKNIIFTGWLSGDDRKAVYLASDLVLVPSICFDSFPTVILEAMISRKPVVATCFGGAREMVVDGQSGYIVNPFNSQIMAEKMIDLLIDGSKSKRFGETGYVRVRDKFGLDGQIEHLLKLC